MDALGFTKLPTGYLHARLQREEAAEFSPPKTAKNHLATLRRLALNLLKREKTQKRGIKGKQLNAGWNHVYLPCLFGVEI